MAKLPFSEQPLTAEKGHIAHPAILQFDYFDAVS